jgi:hypothetical protein
VHRLSSWIDIDDELLEGDGDDGTARNFCVNLLERLIDVHGGVAEIGGGVDKWVLVNAGVGLVLTGQPFDGVAGNGFWVNIERTYVEYGPGPLKSFSTIASNLLSVLATTVNSHSK